MSPANEDHLPIKVVIPQVSSRKSSFAPPRQPVALLATIRDPDKQLPVYNEVVTMMNRVGWITQNLPVKEAVRIRMGT